MNSVLKSASGIVAAAILLFASAASAAPVAFSITGAQFTPGAGYGQDSDENSGTQLDVRFNNAAFSIQNFTLTGAGAFTTFTYGTIGLFEIDGHGGILAGETDNLNVTAAFTFLHPTVGIPQTLSATGFATVGSVSDLYVDYVINWSPILVSFGSGGQFQIDLNDLAFSTNGQGNTDGETQTQTATIRLIKEEQGPGLPPNDVPEPSTIALLGLGLLGAAFSRRKSGAGSA
jgi:hypothetical protein